MINNLELIKSLLDFKSDDDFYFVQVIQRKKDNPGTRGSNNSARIIKAYYIKSIEQLDKQFEEMVMLANHYNARVGINLNKRSFERLAFHTLKKITDQILNKDYKSVRKAYNSVCGEYGTGDKFWIIDIDDKEYDSNPLIEFINIQRPIGEKVVCNIPTKSGYHIITKPFDLTNYGMLFTHDLHKNNPTNLYIP